jgi:hypothetical protein
MPMCGKWQCALLPARAATGSEPARSDNWNTPGLDDVLPGLFKFYAKDYWCVLWATLAHGLVVSTYHPLLRILPIDIAPTDG